jgi:hypothetical protein
MIGATERRPMGCRSRVVYGETTGMNFIRSSSTSEMPDCYHFHSNPRIIAGRHGASRHRFSGMPDTQLREGHT